ncbi:MAG: Flp family type IVb pilin [Alphaproteobacteria bacterium]|nr:Flp family type IVb pilin [Alphaproteobacteria bacterium]
MREHWLLADEEGRTGIGYALIGLLIAVAVGTSAMSLGSAVSGAFGRLAERIEAAAPQTVIKPSERSRVIRDR